MSLVMNQELGTGTRTESLNALQTSEGIRIRSTERGDKIKIQQVSLLIGAKGCLGSHGLAPGPDTDPLPVYII